MGDDGEEARWRGRAGGSGVGRRRGKICGCSMESSMHVLGAL